MTTTGTRSNQERREKEDRRKVKLGIDPDRRKGGDRRTGVDRRENK